MRVLELVTSAHWGGAQQQVLSISQALASGGHDVLLACGEDGPLLSRAAAVGIPVRRLGWMRSGVDPLAEFRSLLEVAGLIRAVKPDVVHTHSSKAGVIGRLAAARAARALGRPVPVVHHCHGLAWGAGRQGGLAGRAFRTAEKLTGHLCCGVVSVSQAVADLLARDSIYPRARHVTIHNGIELGNPGPGPFTASPERRTALGLPPHGTVVAHVGRAVAGKGHHLALDAFEVTAAAGEDLHLVLIGDGPLLPAICRRAAASPGLRGRVHALGFRDDVPALLRASDALCLPSEAEGLPLVVIEAMAASLPVVATAVGGIPELVVPGETGLLTGAAPTAAQFADALVAVHRSPGRAAEMGRAGRARAERFFSLQNTSRTIDFLCDIGHHAHSAA